MRVTRYDDPCEFSRTVTPLLLRREVENNLLGLVLQMASSRQHDGVHMCAVGDGRAAPVGPR